MRRKFYIIDFLLAVGAFTLLIYLLHLLNYGFHWFLKLWAHPGL